MVEKRSWHLGHCMVLIVSHLPVSLDPATSLAAVAPHRPGRLTRDLRASASQRREPVRSVLIGGPVGRPILVRRRRRCRTPAAPDHHLAAGPDRRRTRATTPGQRRRWQDGPAVGRRGVGDAAGPCPAVPGHQLGSGPHRSGVVGGQRRTMRDRTSAVAHRVVQGAGGAAGGRGRVPDQHPVPGPGGGGHGRGGTTGDRVPAIGAWVVGRSVGEAAARVPAAPDQQLAAGPGGGVVSRAAIGAAVGPASGRCRGRRRPRQASPARPCCFPRTRSARVGPDCAEGLPRPDRTGGDGTPCSPGGVVGRAVGRAVGGVAEPDQHL